MRLRLLVVDDESGVRSLVKGVFARKEGVELFEARDGAEALKILLEERIDLVLLDLLMPIMGGLDTLRTIRANPLIADVAVLILTGQADEQRIRVAIDLGIKGCLTKPFSVTDLRERVETLLATLCRPDGSVRRAVGRVALTPADRILVIDQSPDVCRVARQVLGRVCTVETDPNEFSALMRCRQDRFQAVVLGLLTNWSDPEGVAARFRQLPNLAGTPLIVMAPPSDLAAIARADRFDAVVLRRLEIADFELAIAPIVDVATRSRLLFHPESDWLAATFQTFTETLSAAFGPAVRLVAGAPDHAPRRSVAVDTELQGPHMDRILHLRCSMESALVLVSRWLATPLDEVADTHASQAVSKLAMAMAQGLVSRAAEVGLRCESGQQTVVVQGAPGFRPASDVPRGVTYQFVDGERDLGVVEIVPSVVRSSAMAFVSKR